MGNTLTFTADLDQYINNYGWKRDDPAVNRVMQSDKTDERDVVERRLTDIRKVLWVWHASNVNDWQRPLITAGIAGGILLGNRHLEGSSMGRFARGTGLVVLCANGLVGSVYAFAGAGVLAQLARHK